MAHLWFRDREGWGVVALTDTTLSLDGRLPRPISRDDVGATNGPLVTQAPIADRWVLVSRRTGAVQVNGIPLATGVRVLQDRDEVRVRGAGTCYFTNERLARVEPFPGADHPVYCARCKQVIAVGSDAVQCPACGIWHHQGDDFPCWTYAPSCSMCPQPTALDAGFRWTPEDL